MKVKYFIFSIMLIVVVSELTNGQNSKNAESVTASKVIAEIIKHTGNSSISNTVDVIKEGDPQEEETREISLIGEINY